jgi:hypothetical protein
MEKGIEKGRAEGEAIGMEKVIISGKRNGFTIAQLQIITNLSKEKIEEILNQ